VVSLLTTGALAPFFWIEVISGIITMLIAFTPRLRSAPLIVVASVLSVLAILCKRIQLLVGGFQEANISYPAVTTGPGLSDAGSGLANIAPALIYFPSPLELSIVLGVLGLGVLLLLLGLRLLPLKPVEGSH
jgi:molybdopterin-containing oxidoreductase family membrane subunit